MDNNRWVAEALRDRGIALLGYADLREIDEHSRRGFRFGIVFAMALRRFPSATDRPSKAYYEEYNEVSAKLIETSRFLAGQIEARGYRAVPAGTKQDDCFRTPLPFKTLATRAGLGWIGKSAALITKEYGNAIRLNGVLTDMPLATGTPINASRCGDCTECVRLCPGGAIVGKSWDVRIDRDDLLDACKCKATVIERGKIWDVTEGSCGVCIAACPWTKGYMARCSIEGAEGESQGPRTMDVEL